jgi:hypothetical protein
MKNIMPIMFSHSDLYGTRHEVRTCRLTLSSDDKSYQSTARWRYRPLPVLCQPLVALSLIGRRRNYHIHGEPRPLIAAYAVTDADFAVGTPVLSLGHDAIETRRIREHRVAERRAMRWRLGMTAILHVPFLICIVLVLFVSLAITLLVAAVADICCRATTRGM